jgi:hypothetical protein
MREKENENPPLKAKRDGFLRKECYDGFIIPYFDKFVKGFPENF